jgi:hypothetical protein
VLFGRVPQYRQLGSGREGTGPRVTNETNWLETNRGGGRAVNYLCYWSSRGREGNLQDALVSCNRARIAFQKLLSWSCAQVRYPYLYADSRRVIIAFGEGTTRTRTRRCLSSGKLLVLSHLNSFIAGTQLPVTLHGEKWKMRVLGSLTVQYPAPSSAQSGWPSRHQ